ncbi:MAG: hypothetical protein ABIO24_05660, partial [Saprospiraceae bacterium]
MLDQLNMADFSPHLNQPMTIRFNPETSLPAELVQVREVGSYTPLDRKPFAIVLRTDQKNQYFEQGICVLEHPEKGDLPLFFVPVGQDPQGMLY